MVLISQAQLNREFCEVNGNYMNTILATTDFSLENRSMLQYAAHLAMDLNYRLRLIHATHVPLASDEFFSTEATLASLSASDRGQMLQEVVWLRNKFGTSLVVDTDVNIGYVQELVRQELHETNVVLMIMSVSNSTKVERFLFGSSVSHAIGHMPCPLLLIPKNYTYRKWKSIAIAYDKKELGASGELEVINKALALADGKVHAVHVQSDSNDTLSNQETEKLSKWIQKPIIKVHEILNNEKTTSESLLDWTHRYRPNTMLMIARKHGLLHQLMHESISRNLAFHTNTPLLICPDNARETTELIAANNSNTISI
jgi:nucleotide-binding universal stress UspA family protein